MSNEKTATDQFVRRQIESLGVSYTEQKSSIAEVNDALRGASKHGVGIGKPEFVFQILDYLIVLEDKYQLERLEALGENGVLLLDGSAVSQFATNGAVHYARHIARKSTSFKKIIAIGVAGDAHRNEIQPYLVTAESTRKLPPLKSLTALHPDSFQEYIDVVINGEIPYSEREIRRIKGISETLHEALRNYGNLEGERKANVVSAILLALENPKFSFDQLTATDPAEDESGEETDGYYIWEAARKHLVQRGVKPAAKLGIMLDQFSFIKTDVTLNRKNDTLGMSPLKYYAATLNKEVLSYIKSGVDTDVLGNFYGEFVRYGGSDGNPLGIVLTPSHICRLMGNLVDLKPTDKVLDPCCGTGAFLITAMNQMIESEPDAMRHEKIKEEQLFGFELQNKLFTVATTNMVLRSDGKANIARDDCFSPNADSLRSSDINKVLMNPPYSQAKDKTNAHLSELRFIERALDLMTVGGRLCAIVPQSVLSGKTKDDRQTKVALLKDHTLEMAITVNPQTFHGIGVNPAIIVMTAKVPHPSHKKVTFIDFRSDGYQVRKHLGLVPDGTETDKREHLLRVISGDEDDTSEFVVKALATAQDEWLHSYFYFDETPPLRSHLDLAVRNYVSHITQLQLEGRPQGRTPFPARQEVIDPGNWDEISWAAYTLEEIGITARRGKRLTKAQQFPGSTPYISSSALRNGVDGYVGNTDKVRRYANCATIANSGSVGAAFFHPYEFVASDHVTALKGESFNVYHYLFLVGALSGTGSKYSFNRELTDSRIARETIYLPSSESGTPDLAIMEAFAFSALESALRRVSLTLPNVSPAQPSRP